MGAIREGKSLTESEENEQSLRVTGDDVNEVWQAPVEGG